MLSTVLLFSTLSGASAAERPLLLWEVRKGEAVSWLMGTCHVPIPLAHALPKPYPDELRGARVFVSELDIQAMLEPMALLHLLIDPEQDLRQSVGLDTFRAHAARLSGVVPAPMLARMEPWVAGTMSEMLTPKPASGPSAPLDKLLADVARDAQVPPVYLETAEEQLSLMSGLNDAFAEAMVPGAASAEETARLADQMSAACLDADLDSLARVIESGPDDVLVAILDRRNKAWLNIVLDQMGQGGAFVAVGVGHMVGPTGLVAQLEQEGFTVTRHSTRRRPQVPEDLAVGSRIPLSPFVPDPAKSAAWEPAFHDPIAAVCAEGGPARCFAAADTCEVRLADAVGMCLDQQLAGLPAAPNQDGTVAVLGCAIGGVAIEGLVTGAGADTPACSAMREEMVAGMGQALTGSSGP